MSVTRAERRPRAVAAGMLSSAGRRTSRSSPTAPPPATGPLTVPPSSSSGTASFPNGCRAGGAGREPLRRVLPFGDIAAGGKANWGFRRPVCTWCRSSRALTRAASSRPTPSRGVPASWHRDSQGRGARPFFSGGHSATVARADGGGTVTAEPHITQERPSRNDVAPDGPGAKLVPLSGDAILRRRGDAARLGDSRP